MRSIQKGRICSVSIERGEIVMGVMGGMGTMGIMGDYFSWVAASWMMLQVLASEAKTEFNPCCS